MRGPGCSGCHRQPHQRPHPEQLSDARRPRRGAWHRSSSRPRLGTARAVPAPRRCGVGGSGSTGQSNGRPRPGDAGWALGTFPHGAVPHPADAEAGPAGSCGFCAVRPPAPGGRRGGAPTDRWTPRLIPPASGGRVAGGTAHQPSCGPSPVVSAMRRPVPAPSSSKRTVCPSVTAPDSMARASWSSMVVCMSRRSGRAP